jgi:hypothetical protein
MPLLRSLGCRAAVGLCSLLGPMLLASTADAAPPAGADVPARTSVYTDEGLLGSVRLVPAVGVGAPDGMRFGIFAKYKGVIALGGAFSTLPETKLPGLDATVVRVTGEAFVRVHPFQGAFFLGVAGGYSRTKGTMADQVEAFRQVQRVETRGYASALYIAPHLGFQWMLPMGLTVGFDAGVEIPVASNDPTFDAAKYGLVVPIEPTGSAADATHFIATMPVPVIHILELGYAL